MGRGRAIVALLVAVSALLGGCTSNPIEGPKPPVYRSPSSPRPDGADPTRANPCERANPNACDTCRPGPSRANPSEPSTTTLPPAPPSGHHRWDVVRAGGAPHHTETVPATEPWIRIDADGTIRARIPPSAESRAAAGALGPGSAVTVQQGR